MKTRMLCSVLALFCLISMYVPVIAPQYPAGEYYAPPGNTQYFFTGEYYCAREYWSVTDFAFASLGWVGRIVVSMLQALLILWAWMSVRGEAGKWGLAIAVANVAVVGVVLAIMMSRMWACRWGVVVVTLLAGVMAVALAATSAMEEKKGS